MLVAWEDRPESIADLCRIGARVSEIAPSIQAYVISKRQRDQFALLPLWLRPTLSFAMRDVTRRKLLPGTFVSGRHMGKIGEYVRMDRAGIPVPRWQILTPDTRLDPAVWGPYVVEKPAEGRHGANTRIRKTTRVTHTPPEALPADHYGRLGPMLVQQFIYTGEWPISYRVVTFFGEVLLSYRQTTRNRGTPLSGRWNFGRSGGITIVSNTKDMEIAFDSNPDVVGLAERAHQLAFGDIPLLGFDIVQDAETGAVYVLECHAHGSGWSFSSKLGLQLQADSGLNFESQYDAVERVAHILARLTPRLATRRLFFNKSDVVRWKDRVDSKIEGMRDGA